jgi:hypothetical protein
MSSPQQFRPYFLMGDVLSNAVIGAVAGVAVASLISPTWPMFAAMAAGMVLGHFLALIVGVLAFFRYFGMMEIMLPTMITGMLAGMFIGMAAARNAVDASDAAIAGALIGLGTLVVVSAMNYVINGRFPT